MCATTTNTQGIGLTHGPFVGSDIPRGVFTALPPQDPVPQVHTDKAAGFEDPPDRAVILNIREGQVADGSGRVFAEDLVAHRLDGGPHRVTEIWVQLLPCLLIAPLNEVPMPAEEVGETAVRWRGVPESGKHRPPRRCLTRRPGAL